VLVFDLKNSLSFDVEWTNFKHTAHQVSRKSITDCQG